MSHPTPTHRRWFQFSLRTLFVVVTIFAIWLGWGLNWARERERTLDALRATPSSHARTIITEPQQQSAVIKPWRRLPLTLRILRSEAVGVIYLSQAYYSQGDREYLESLFPEATILLQ